MALARSALHFLLPSKQATVFCQFPFSRSCSALISGPSTLPWAIIGEADFHVRTASKLSGEPIFQIASQKLQVNPGSGLHQTVRNGQKVVKGAPSSKAPHAETIQPGDRTIPGFSRFQNLDMNFSGKHNQISPLAEKRTAEFSTVLLLVRAKSHRTA